MDPSHTSSSIEKCFAADHGLLDIMIHWVIDAIDRRMSRAEIARLFAECEQYALSHMDIEEKHLLSELILVREEDAKELLDEHRQLRHHMAELAAKADAGHLSARDLLDLAAELEAHSAKEERALYAWCAGTLSLAQLSTIFRYMNDIARRRSERDVSTSFSRA